MKPSCSKGATPAVSVLLPVFNAARYLRTAVDSVLAQTFIDFELLAFDDGSTDKSLPILREYEAKDTRVKVNSKENRGLTPTLNELITIARGRYLARMDSDDICRPQRFEKQVAYLDSQPACVAVGSRIRFIDSDGMPIFDYGDKFTHEEIDLAHVSSLHGSQICHPSVMMRKEAVVRIGGYCEEYRFAQDIDLFLRLAEIGRLANLPDILLEYRYNMNGTSFVHVDEQDELAMQAVRAAWSRRGIGVAPNFQKRERKHETNADLHRKWAWWAISSGNIPTARKHALRALVRDPLSLENFRVFACAIRGR